MADEKGFVRLNREQKRVLDALKPFDGVEGGLPKISEDGKLGRDVTRDLPIVDELEELGYVTFRKNEEGRIEFVSLSSWAYCYRREYFMNLFVPTLLQMLGGISGGLVVWLLTKLLG